MSAQDSLWAWGDGLATITDSGKILDCWFPEPKLGRVPADRDWYVAPKALADEAHEDPRRGVRLHPLVVESDLSAPVQSTQDAYLRLHLLSHLLVKPHGQNLTGLWDHLPANAWTDLGPMDAEEISTRLPALRRGGVQVYAIDKLPRLLDYLVPKGVRIADGGRVRLGAYLSPGTIVMHEGFVNCNAGTLGPSIIEGRLSQGIVIGAHTDIGGGASVMGMVATDSPQRVLIGERSLIGANAGVGFGLGDDCVVEAGLYVTAGTKVTVVAEQRNVKAGELAGVPNLLFRRNSLTGAVEVFSRNG
ncbi:DapH/DapD/GlmU-related protein [Gulosibacter molinativorax]|uniref:2,3,4,5-tetrahydropyridine-2,6-dicarboxylate N-succinyltransferase n=1 Tax=Gulosibacter molinativorax TaxID=256821 RepID=A0ABT7C5V3_9MICO|nr:DapH/DapD/GlmU-related protein [Gulosibacter molinativorax]MDJ1370564.1 2,3,4,5-tetrahydropyridine-2,6-dicarboxylate N-succinyltransferase [Gulosibacter molinativorax]QUY62023.1 2,3,4,5-tetrahydropyridine-2,6-dicarboxylate N-succinyltransferase [Gulosibacter molinativorax]